MAGDFNLHHPLWDSHVPANHIRGNTKHLADWFLNNIHIDNDPDTPTRRGQPGQRDTIIDLIGFSGIYNGTFDPIAVRPDLNTGSDHYPITTTIHLLQNDADSALPDPPNLGHTLKPNKKEDWITAFQTVWEGLTITGNPIPSIHNPLQP
ncbi:hypothetical protein H0H81_012788 [Sphagnurus paluster]|uniref:Endonuclease/exonuclease/phosphatase domain-containing protein n=1 Tax=Sphagnurus paluster TaxID=117069 RepID=A0A9P7K210_9AGAR|nr:hypothetical protein H0H81_012788 [Sphagnurus paluster]